MKTQLQGKVRHSIAEWPFKQMGHRWDIEETCEVAKDLGAESVELVDSRYFSVVRANGLKCAIALPPAIELDEPPFLRGFNDKKNYGRLLEVVEENMRVCKEFEVPSTLVFTGYKWSDPVDSQSPRISIPHGLDACVTGLQNLAKVAETYKVVACLEHLNTRDGSHPMKGHPGYWGDDIDVVAEIVRGVGSKWIRLLFDVYHVQVMHGDIISRLRQHAHLIGHVHTAGCPGRGELNEYQEINYPAVMRALVETGYKGYVGHEFIPTVEPKVALRQAIRVCDV